MITCCEVDSLEMAEVLRVLRNECAAWMTNDTSQITPERQRVFYETKVKTGLITGFVMYDDYAPVAYGLHVLGDNGMLWSSTGVKESMRGLGYGKRVYIENAKRAWAKGQPLWADVRCDNDGQQHVCHSLDNVYVGTKYMADSSEEGGFYIDTFYYPDPSL